MVEVSFCLLPAPECRAEEAEVAGDRSPHPLRVVGGVEVGPRQEQAVQHRGGGLVPSRRPSPRAARRVEPLLIERVEPRTRPLRGRRATRCASAVPPGVRGGVRGRSGTRAGGMLGCELADRRAIPRAARGGRTSVYRWSRKTGPAISGPRALAQRQGRRASSSASASLPSASASIACVARTCQSSAGCLSSSAIRLAAASSTLRLGHVSASTCAMNRCPVPGDDRSVSPMRSATCTKLCCRARGTPRRVGGNDRSDAAVERDRRAPRRFRSGERARRPRCSARRDARGSGSSRSAPARRASSLRPQLDVALASAASPSSSRGTSDRPSPALAHDDSAAVAGGRAGELCAAAPRRRAMRGRSRKALFAAGLSPGRALRIAEREEELAAQLLVGGRQLERVDAPSGTGARPPRTRAARVRDHRRGGAYSRPSVEVAARDRVVGELGEMRPGLVAVERLERLDRRVGAAGRGGRS